MVSHPDVGVVHDADVDRNEVRPDRHNISWQPADANPEFDRNRVCSAGIGAQCHDALNVGQVQEALRRMAASTACHAAVKANDPLTYEKMAHILDELRATAYSTVCPHGRPVMLRLTRREIEKNFDRI